MVKINGQEVPLANIQIPPKTVQCVLAPRYKHHSEHHYKYMHPLIQHQANNLNFLRGCVKTPQPQMRTRAHKKTLKCTPRATNIRNVLARVYAVTIQNMNTDIP